MSGYATDNTTSGGRGSPNAISPGSDGHNWTNQRGNQTPSFSGTQLVFTYNGNTTLGVWTYSSLSENVVEILFDMTPNSTSDIIGGILCQSGTSYYYCDLGNISGKFEIGIAPAFTSLNSATFAFSAGTTYTVRMQYGVATSTTLRAKVWQKGSGEPGSWTVSATDSTLSAGGGFGLCMAPVGGGTCTFDTFSATNGAAGTQVIKDIAARFRLQSAVQLKDVATRFRLQSAAQLKDVATRFRLQSPNQLKDLATRFRLQSPNQLKDLVTRFRLQSANQLKDLSTRFRLQSANQLKDIATRFRLQSANQLKDMSTRFRLQSGNQLKDLSARFRLQSTNQPKDVSTRFRLQSANQLRDLSFRWRLQSANQLRDVAFRFRLAGNNLNTKDLACRFGLSSMIPITMVIARGRDGLAVASSRDGLVVASGRDGLTHARARDGMVMATGRDGIVKARGH